MSWIERGRARIAMAEVFYPFVGSGQPDHTDEIPPDGHATVSCTGGMPPRSVPNMVENPARIAVFDDLAAAPRVVVIQPAGVRSYLEEITATVTQLARDQGGRISFAVIREVVENLIHAYFIEPTISILNDGNTIRFSDQGPGIREKSKALEYGTTSATEEMKRYIRGVGSGLPYAQQYLCDHGGSLTIEDNISSGTVVTISMQGDTPKEMPVVMTPQPVMAPQPNASCCSAKERVVDSALTQRGCKALLYLKDHDSVGPTELSRCYGSSLSTWTRELKHLESQGLVRRGDQKRFLTSSGYALVQTL